MTDRHRIPMGIGFVGWTFPGLTDPSDVELVSGILTAADELLFQVGQKLGTRPDAYWPQGVAMHRLMFYRLGPEPLYTKTDLISEGLSDDLYVFVHLQCVQPQGWQAYARVDLVCDVDPDWCTDHEIEGGHWSADPVDTPLVAAQQVHAAALWVDEFIAANSIASLRGRDPRRGHAPLSREASLD